MRTVAGLFVGGVVAVVAFKLITALVLPLLGIFFGLIALAIKLAIVVAVGWFVYSLVRNRKREQGV
jgi:hypothetical protein